MFLFVIILLVIFIVPYFLIKKLFLNLFNLKERERESSSTFHTHIHHHNYHHKTENNLNVYDKDVLRKKED